MHRVSIVQAVKLWSQLERAYHGTADYDGHTTLIYLYDLMSYNPLLVLALTRDDLKQNGLYPLEQAEALETACSTLLAFLQHFAATRGAKILVEGKPLGPWVKQLTDPRVRVEVRPPEKVKAPDPTSSGKSL